VRWVIAWLVTACSFQHGVAPDGGSGANDAVERDPDTSVATGPWSTPTLVASLATGNAKDDPSLSADLLEMYFNACPTDCEILVTTRATPTSAWSTPVVVSEVTSTALESTPRVSPDGLTLYFTSQRSGGPGSDDIYRSVRANRTSAWGSPVLVAELSTGGSEYGASPDPTSTRLVFNADRTPSQGQDIWETTADTVGVNWGTPTLLANINSSTLDLSACLSADGLTLYFHSARVANDELYVATRTTLGSPFSAPQPIAELNSPYADDDPWVSPDGHTMFFASDRDSPGVMQIYESHR
jgi:Tol biopolymer transport system component